MVQQILENVREQSYAHGIEQYYVAFVVMMYVVSSSILKEVRTNRIMSIMQDADKKSDPNK